MDKKHMAEILAGVIAAGIVIHFAVNPADVDLMRALQKRLSEIFIKKQVIKESGEENELGTGSLEPHGVDPSADDKRVGN